MWKAGVKICMFICFKDGKYNGCWYMAGKYPILLSEVFLRVSEYLTVFPGKKIYISIFIHKFP